MIMPGIMSEGSVRESVPRYAALQGLRFPLPGAWDRRQCFAAYRRRPEQNPINHLLVLIGNGGDLSGDAEHHVEILHRQQVGLAAFQPLGFGKTLTLVAMPVRAGVVTDTAMPAGIAFFYMAAQRRCSTHFYGM